MSGGRFNYQNDMLAKEIFSYAMSPNYGEKGFAQSMLARKQDPFEDKQISEIAWDIFCLMHSLDYYESGDICEETYREDVKRFKEKWLKKTEAEATRLEIDKSLAETRHELYKTLDAEHANASLCNMIFGILLEKGECEYEALYKAFEYTGYSKNDINNAVDCMVRHHECIVEGAIIRKL